MEERIGTLYDPSIRVSKAHPLLKPLKAQKSAESLRWTMPMRTAQPAKHPCFCPRSKAPVSEARPVVGALRPGVSAASKRLGAQGRGGTWSDLWGDPLGGTPLGGPHPSPSCHQESTMVRLRNTFVRAPHPEAVLGFPSGNTLLESSAPKLEKINTDVGRSPGSGFDNAGQPRQRSHPIPQPPTPAGGPPMWPLDLKVTLQA